MPIFDQGDGSWVGRGGRTGGRNDGTRTAPPSQYETATLQVLIGEGQIEGLVDGLKSIYLDGTPILNSDGSKNFKGVALALVAGTNTQSAVEGVGGVESEVSVNVQVTAAASVTRSITSNPSAIRVRIALPALKIINTDGGSVGHSVFIKIERQNAAYNGGAWEIVPLERVGLIRGGPYSTKFTRSFRVDLPASGTWQVRVTRMSADDADAYHLSQTWWEAYTEIIDARLRYPNSAVLSLRVNANQFRSIPKVSLDLKLSRIQVPANYDPLTRAYATTGTGTTGGAWDGTFKEAWSDNPAWVFYDAATKTRYGAGSFLDTSALDKWTLYTIAQWCDTLVDDGKGGTEPRLTCNLYMQNQQNAIKALGQLASIFWGVIYYASGLVVPVADADTEPVAVFNSSNVIDGKFTYEGTARSARHTAAIVKFTNPDLGWEPDTAVHEDADGIARFGYNPLDLNALGCTSHGQALRLARWSILTELLADETISFSSGLEGSTVKPGDVVQVHDQFRAGNFRFGGRVATGATTTVIPLDAPVTFGGGTHYLKVKNASGVLETRTVTTPAGTVSSLTVSSGFSVAPAEGAVWLLQSGTIASLWRVLAIRKGEGITYDITALKHDPTKYTLLALASGDVVPREVDPRTATAPAGLVVSATTRILNDRQVQSLEANWMLDGALSYTAVASKDYGPWAPMAVSGATAILSGIDPGSWRVRVVGTWAAGNSPFSEATAVVTAPDTLPGWINAALTPSVVADGVTTQFLYTGPTVTCEDWRGVWTLSPAPRTNLIKQSKDYSSTAWTKYANGLATLPVVTANAGLAPDGTMTADRITFNRGGSASTDICTVSQNVTGQTIGNPYAPSIWLKSNTGANQQVMIYWSGLATGKGGGTITNVVTVTPQWQRFSCADLAANTTLAIQFGCRVSYGDMTLDILAWESQLETGTAPTPNIPTGASAVTVTDITVSNGLATLSPAPLQGAILRGVSSNAAQAAALAAPAIVADHAAISLPNADYPAGRLVFQTGGAPAGSLWQVNAAGTGWQAPNPSVAISAAHLAAVLAIVGEIKSNGTGGVYNGTSSVMATVGFKIAGTPFAAMGANGVTHSVCADYSGPVMIAGYLASTYADRVFQPFNRLTNGKFAYSASPWAVSGTYTAWNATTKTAGTGSLKTSVNTSTSSTGTVTQSFTMPVSTGTVTLALTTGFGVSGNTSNLTMSSEVKAYILDTNTGTETLAATWTSTSTATSLALAWTDRSVDISSLVSAGGDFALRLEHTVSRGGAIGATATGYIDEVSIIA